MSRPALSRLLPLFEDLMTSASKRSPVPTEFNSRPTNWSLDSFVLRLAECLEYEEDEELVIWGLILMQRAIEAGLAVTKRCLYRYGQFDIDW